MIYLASDHAGYRLKEEIKDYLSKLGIGYKDLGPKRMNPKDDYPDFAFKIAKQVAKNPEKDKGILICGTGQGMMRAANKIKGVRAVLAWDEYTAETAKAHQHANILTLGGRTTFLEMAKKIVSKWLATGFDEQERHKRRLSKIEKCK